MEAGGEKAGCGAQTSARVEKSPVNLLSSCSCPRFGSAAVSLVHGEAARMSEGGVDPDVWDDVVRATLHAWLGRYFEPCECGGGELPRQGGCRSIPGRTHADGRPHRRSASRSSAQRDGRGRQAECTRREERQHR